MREGRYSASDLSNFLACRHLTRLEVAALHGLVEKPHIKDLGFEALVKRGEEHEQQVLEEYRSREWSIVEIAERAGELEGGVDVLVMDEAGQMSLADTLACARSASSLILLGDPMQLAQPQQGAHPPGSEVSALELILGDHATMPDDLGLFIERTRRMHPAITAFTSEVFYEGRLAGLPELERQAVLCEGPFAGSGLRVVDVEHGGNRNSCRRRPRRWSERSESCSGVAGGTRRGRRRRSARATC